MHILRHTRIVATIGPASSGKAVLGRLVAAGVDVFRLNFSHGEHADHARRCRLIRDLEQEAGRPLGILADLQGPKLRVGRFRDGGAQLQPGQAFRLDLDETLGDDSRVSLPHPEIFAALEPGTELLLDDGRLRLRVQACASDHAQTVVQAGGALSDHKGVNVPGATLPISALTDKDRQDLAFALEHDVDWVALSFVQRPEDVAELRALVGRRAWIMAKLEKPAAIKHLEGILEQADGVMVARGDLGVELPLERVPVLQERIVRRARAHGKPVVVATQMLDSMVAASVPTRAEASDVATAVYSGADAVMLSAESAAGKYPVESVCVMDRIIRAVEDDMQWKTDLAATRDEIGQASVPDAICRALRSVSTLLKPAATVAYTASGFSALRASRERPAEPIVALAPRLTTARRLTMVWGVLPVHFPRRLRHAPEIIGHAVAIVRERDLARPGDVIVIIAGLPFGRSGSTNLLHIAEVGSERLRKREPGAGA